MLEKREEVRKVMAKEFTFRGKTLEELEKMSLKEFANLLTTRGKRTLLRYLNRGFDSQYKSLIEKVKKTKQGTYSKPIKTHCRDMIVIPNMVGTIIHIYSGKIFNAVTIVPEMLGHYLGEFSMTRQKVEHSAPGVGATKSSAGVAKAKK